MDTALLLFVNQRAANPLFDILMPALSSNGYLLVVPFLIYMFFRAAQNRPADAGSFLADACWTILIAVAAVFAVDLLESVLKPLIGRVRPCNALEGIRLLVQCPTGPSMPSGHALSSFAFATPLFVLLRKHLTLAMRLVPIALAAAIAFSRVYLGVHYPTDILVGALLGIGVSLALCGLYRSIRAVWGRRTV